MATISETLAIATQHHQAGQLPIAEQLYRQILAVDPGQPEALHLLGVVLFQTGKHELALEQISRAIALKGTEAAFHNNLGNIFKDLGKFDEAIACYQRALELQPGNIKARNNLGTALLGQEKLDEAVACLRFVLEQQPEYAVAHNNLGLVFKDQGRLDEAIACFRQAIKLRPDYFAAQRSLLYTVWFSPLFDSTAIYEEHCRWHQQWAEPFAKDVVAHANDPTPSRRLRIGYVGSDFRNHCQSLFTVPLLTAHDRQAFEIVCYPDVASPDDLTSWHESKVDKWRNVVGLSDEEVARLVRQDQIDILVDLTMHMERGRSLVFARKPAPVQVCWLAYPGTTGLKAIDYRFTDPHLDPPGVIHAYYSEQTIHLQDCFWCYDPLTNEPKVNSLPTLHNQYVTFGCLNNFCKVNAAVLKLWAHVLKAVERSRLLLLAPEGSVRQTVRDVLGAEGVSADRISFVARQPRRNYLELYHQIDIGLDTFPYNGHTTSLDSFWMGVPVVTLVGKTAVGRAGLCQLHNLGMPAMVAYTPEQFVEISTGLANDWRRLSEIRGTLRERMENSPLMDALRFARSMEAAYRSIWREWCQRES